MKSSFRTSFRSAIGSISSSAELSTCATICLASVSPLKSFFSMVSVKHYALAAIPVNTYTVKYHDLVVKGLKIPKNSPILVYSDGC